jgi:AraC-like DNA-binding protein
MQHFTGRMLGSLPADAGEAQLGLFRREALASGPAGTVGNLFADLRRLSRGQIIGEHPERHLQGTRLSIDRTQGDGSWEFYRLDQDLYLMVADGFYDTPRVETVPGEGLVEFHVRLTGTLEMQMPGDPTPVTVTGPRLLMLHQPAGIDVLERVSPRLRDTCISLYCRPEFLADLARRNGITRWPLLDELRQHPSNSVWHRQTALSPTLLYIGKSLLESPYRRAVRLLHAEAKALELLCEVLAAAQQEDEVTHAVVSENQTRQLDVARRMLAANLSAPLRICDIARTIGMSESKLKRTFKARFGLTVFDYGLECRMRHALELLRCKRMSVGQVAYLVGYRHQTSFASAFREFFGFLPSKARTDMH